MVQRGHLGTRWDDYALNLSRERGSIDKGVLTCSLALCFPWACLALAQRQPLLYRFRDGRCATPVLNNLVIIASAG